MLHAATVILGLLGVFLALLYVRIGMGLCRLENWARRAYPWLTGILFLALTLLFVSFLRQIPAGVAIIVASAIPFPWMIWYLRSAGVRLAFGSQPESSSSSPIPGPPPKPSMKRFVLPAAASIAGIIACLWIFVSSIQGAMESSELFKLTAASAEASPCIASTIGVPVSQTLNISGSWEEGSATGKANLTLPIHGPKGAGRLYVKASKRQGKWMIEKLFLLQGGSETALIPAQGVGCFKTETQ
jgi:hypothetical protein